MKAKAKIALLLLLLFVFSSKSDAGNNQAVLDTDGEEVRQGVLCYALPAYRGRGGGLNLTQAGDGSCPYHVVQDIWPLSSGFPVIISNVGNNDDDGSTICESGIQFISFATQLEGCNESMVWKLDDHYHEYVTTGGSRSRFFNSTRGTFTIGPYKDDGYRFALCPPDRKKCQRLGIVTDASGLSIERRVGVTHNKGWVFVLKKVYDDQQSRIIKQVV